MSLENSTGVLKELKNEQSSSECSTSGVQGFTSLTSSSSENLETHKIAFNLKLKYIIKII